MNENKNEDGTYDEDAKNFAKEVIEAKKENIDAEIDYDDQIIFDKEFNDNPCLKSVYDNMGKTTKFKEYLQNFEQQFSVAHLRFKYDKNFGSNHLDATTALAITKPPLNPK